MQPYNIGERYAYQTVFEAAHQYDNEPPEEDEEPPSEEDREPDYEPDC